MICPYCGESMLLELEIWEHEWMPLFCCEELQWEWSQGDHYELLQLLTADSLNTRGLCEGLIDYKLTQRVLQGGEDWQMAKAVIAQHHRHHQPPVGWKFGVGVWNGPTLVGVATVGRPVSREFPPHVLEVNRNCTMQLQGLERHAASKLYAAAVQEAKRRRYASVITYTYVDESGVSLKAAGWTRTKRVKGRAWSCPSRPRTEKSPRRDKHRWEKAIRPVKFAAHIEVKALVSRRQLDSDDRDVDELYTVTFNAEATTPREAMEELALDQFHSTVPIHTLEDFEITVKQIQPLDKAPA